MAWIFFPDAFLSIVENRDDPDTLLVRGRLRGDIEAVFPFSDVEETPLADYRWRARVPRRDVADAIAFRVESILYQNFKDSIDADDALRSEAYFNVWDEMRLAQGEDDNEERD